MQFFFFRRGVQALGAWSAGLAFMLGAIVADPALAEPRVALVIGNSAYKGDLPALSNPANDAKLMVQALKSVGFDVVSAVDASQDKMKQAIATFSEKLTAGGSEGTGLFFYAGHGVQVGGENYLIPVDAKIKREADVDLVAVSASTVLKQMEFANSAVNIIILDACRNNPLSTGERSASRGLAKIETAPRGSFIAYSTAPGSTAADGDGVNSPYTTALAETITQPGLSIADVFQEVRTKVLASTGNQQTPWDSSSLTGRFYFKPPAETAAVAPEDMALKKELLYWESVKESNDPAEIQAYLTDYPNGNFVDAAKAKLDALQDGTKTARAEPAPGARQSIQSPQPAQPAAQTAQLGIIAMPPQTIYASTAGAQVRAAPNKSADVLVKLSTNEEIKATGETKDGKWWRVKVGDGDGYISKTVASAQPVGTAPATTAQATTPQPPQPQGGAQTAQLTTEGTNEMRGLEMLTGVDSGAGAMPPPSNPVADLQAAGNVASAIQSGNPAAILNALSSASQTQQATAPQVQFLPENKTVTVRKGAVILAKPMHNAAAVARTSLDTKLQAHGRMANNMWWAVVLPNGSLGYVEGRLIRQ